ncbi:hypothetical protein QQS21_003103 [Conoideocrella luteorostrata]|uniref:CFEM domain-containing protein n=1 Tax=Conoideocrella luteorostrata TaxID=1105319 RepID=A0AAJ0FVY0_9HYPO|nr:hypothetical protein QQS21_003103 [Conoideocrella luteorostrata]
MRFKLGLSLLAVSSLASCHGELFNREAALESPKQVLARLPPCAAPCFISAIGNSTCAPSDSQCICASKTIDAEASLCVQMSCSFAEALATKNTTSTACHMPVRDRSGLYNSVAIALGTVSLVFITIRLVFKKFISTARALGWDDWVVLSMIPTRIASTVINAEGMVVFGLGKDIWAIPPSHVPSFATVFYVMEIIYFAEVSLIKLSLCLFYLRIFPTKNIRRLLWATAGFNFLMGFLFAILAAFQCTPVSYVWTQYTEPSSGGHCMNNNSLAWANAAISIFADLWMIAIPLSQVRKLNLSWRKKFSVSVMFLTGTFITIVSILRLRALITFANSSNPTWDQWETAYWSTIEVNTGVMCICLPTLRLILLRLFPEYLRTIRKSNKSYGSLEEGSHVSAARQPQQHQLADYKSATVVS